MTLPMESTLRQFAAALARAWFALAVLIGWLVDWRGAVAGTTAWRHGQSGQACGRDIARAAVRAARR